MSLIEDVDSLLLLVHEGRRRRSPGPTVKYGQRGRTPKGSTFGYRGGVFLRTRRGLQVLVGIDTESRVGVQVSDETEPSVGQRSGVAARIETPIRPRKTVAVRPDLPAVAPEVLVKLERAIDDGKLPAAVSVEKHLELAAKVQAAHDGRFKPLLSELTEMSAGGKVMGRVKKAKSILGKLVKKPKYGTAEGLQDVTGMRIIHESIDDVLRTVDRIKGKWAVVDQDDYISTPQGDYRSFHLIIRDDDGLEKEIQVRTANQNEWAEWAHDVYKPQTPDQEKALAEDPDAIVDYGHAWAVIYYALDTGGTPGPAPDCPAIVLQAFGCLT